MNAIVFPGQGAQYVGMGKSLYENFQEARDVFGAIDRLLGFALSEKCFYGPAEELKNTRLQQLAILSVSIASYEVLKQKKKLESVYFSGLSLGEYSCLYATGVLNLENTLILVKERAEAMEEAARKNPSTMFAVLGVDKRSLHTQESLGFYIANINSPQQIVISLPMDKKDMIKEALTEYGAKVIELQVSGGFHSPFMEDAKEQLKKTIDQMEFKKAHTPIVSNVTARAHQDSEDIKNNLLQQLVSPVLWCECVEQMTEKGVDTFFEVGPQRVLKGLIRKITPQVIVYNFGEKEDFQDANTR